MRRKSIASLCALFNCTEAKLEKAIREEHAENMRLREKIAGLSEIRHKAKEYDEWIDYYMRQKT